MESFSVWVGAIQVRYYSGVAPVKEIARPLILVCMKPVLYLILTAIAYAQSWTPQLSGTNASLRAVSAVSPTVVWASGSGGNVLCTTNVGTELGFRQGA